LSATRAAPAPPSPHAPVATGSATAASPPLPPPMDAQPPTTHDFSSEFLRHHRALWLVAMGVLANAADADDALQEAAIVGVRKSAAFVPGTSFRAWMGEIVRNVSRNRRRGTRREAHHLGRPVDAHTVDLASRVAVSSPLAPDGSVLPGQDAFDDRTLRALARLEPVPRACLLLRCVERLDYAAIAELLDIPKGTAMSHVFRGRRILAEFLATPNATPTTPTTPER